MVTWTWEVVPPVGRRNPSVLVGVAGHFDLPQQWLRGERPVSSQEQVLQRLPKWAVSTGRDTGSRDLAPTH